MTFLELLEKKFFPRKYAEKQKRKESEASSISDGLTEESVAGQEASTRTSFQRRRGFSEHPQKQEPAWKQKLEAILPSPRNPIRRFWRRYHIGKIFLIVIGTLVLATGSYLFTFLRQQRCQIYRML